MQNKTGKRRGIVGIERDQPKDKDWEGVAQKGQRKMMPEFVQKTEPTFQEQISRNNLGNAQRQQ